MGDWTILADDQEGMNLDDFAWKLEQIPGVKRIEEVPNHEIEHEVGDRVGRGYAAPAKRSELGLPGEGYVDLNVGTVVAKHPPGERWIYQGDKTDYGHGPHQGFPAEYEHPSYDIQWDVGASPDFSSHYEPGQIGEGIEQSRLWPEGHENLYKALQEPMKGFPKDWTKEGMAPIPKQYTPGQRKYCPVHGAGLSGGECPTCGFQDKPTEAYWHLAPQARREQIEREGLTPKKPDTTNWGPIVKNQPEGVYAFPTREQAEREREMPLWSEAETAPHDIWEIPADAEGLEFDPNYGGESYYVTQPVPPHRLKRHSNTTGTFHYNPISGKRCECPYHQMHRLLQRSMWKTSDFEANPHTPNLNKVLKAPDKKLNTPEGMEFKNQLYQGLSPEHESLAPYLANQFKQAHIRVVTTPDVFEPAKRNSQLQWWAGEPGGDDTMRFDPGYDTQWHTFNPSTLDLWHNWYQAKQHPLRQGVNVMDKDFFPRVLHQRAMEHGQDVAKKEELAQFRNTGQVVHEFPAISGTKNADIDWDKAFSDAEDKSENQRELSARHEELSRLKTEHENSSDGQWSGQLVPEEIGRPSLEHLRQEYPGMGPGREWGWHIKELQHDGDLEAEGEMMKHCIGSDEQPYKRCLEDGKIKAYSLRDPDGEPHITWHYNSDGSLAEMFAPSDSTPKPQYQSMVDEWGEKTGKPTKPSEAVGMQEKAEKDYYTHPEAEDIDDYVKYHHPERAYETAQENDQDGDIGPETEISAERPDWSSVARDYLQYGDSSGEEYGGGSRFLRALEHQGHNSDFDRALRDEVQEEYPHWPELDHDEYDNYMNSHDAHLQDWVGHYHPTHWTLPSEPVYEEDEPEEDPWGGHPARQANTSGTWHYNEWTGEPCNCPFHRTHMWLRKQADWTPKPDTPNLNKAMRPDKKLEKIPGSALFMRYMGEHFPHQYEALAPWIVNQFKRNNIRANQQSEEAPYLEYYNEAPLPSDPDRERDLKNAPHYWSRIGEHAMLNWHNWYQAKQHPLRQGVNIMEKDWTPYRMVTRAREHVQQLEEEKELEEVKHMGETSMEFPAVRPNKEGIDWKQVRENEVGPHTGEALTPEQVTHLEGLHRDITGPNRGFGMEEVPPEHLGLLKEFEDTYPVNEPGRKAGWHVQHLNPSHANRDEIENNMATEGRLMKHCIGSDNQPYQRAAQDGRIDVYSLRDPRGMPHVTWHYNSDGSLAEMFATSDSAVKPEYEDMIKEWGDKTGKEVDHEVGMQEEEDPEMESFDIPSPEDPDEYVSQHDNPWDWAPEGENIGENTEYNYETPNWDRLAEQFLEGNYPQTRHQYDNGSPFFGALSEKGETKNFDEAMRKEVKEWAPHWPLIRPEDEQDFLPHLQNWRQFWESEHNEKWGPDQHREPWESPITPEMNQDVSNQWSWRYPVHPNQQEMFGTNPAMTWRTNPPIEPGEQRPEYAFSSIKMADKLKDFLMNPKSRPDLQSPEGIEWLGQLSELGDRLRSPHFDPLTPWLTREWKKGRIKFDRKQGAPGLTVKRPPSQEEIERWDNGQGLGTGAELQEKGVWHNLDPYELRHWGDFMGSNHPLKREMGDIMQHHAPAFEDRVKAWDKAMEDEANARAAEELKGGRVVHSWPDGWSVRQLTKPDELKAEGDAMGHCVGSYGGAVETGRSLIYSLRDPAGQPHVTTEIHPKHYETDGERFTKPYEDGDHSAIPNQGEVVQIQGKSNREPLDEYKERMREWFESFPPEERPKREDLEEMLEDPRDIDKGYFQPIDQQPISTDEYGLIQKPRSVNWEALVDYFKEKPRYSEYEVDSDDARQVFEMARHRNEIPQLGNQFKGFQEGIWEDLNDIQEKNYDNYLDNTGPHPEHREEEIEHMSPEEREEQKENSSWHNYENQPIYDEDEFDVPWDEAKKASATKEWEWRDKNWWDEVTRDHYGADHMKTFEELLKPHYNPQTEQYENGTHGQQTF